MVSLFNGALHLLPHNPGPHSALVSHSEHPPPAVILQHRKEKQRIPHPLLCPLDKLKDPHLSPQPTLQNLRKSLLLSRRTIPQLPLHQNRNIPSQPSLQNRSQFDSLLRACVDVVCP